MQRTIKGNSALYLAVSHGHENFEKLPEESKQEGLAYTRIVYHLLQAGARVNETGSEFNPSTAHLNPPILTKANTDVLKMLFAAGARNRKS